MCSHHLGEQVDIHGGGTDLVFPHHENEIAQSEAFFGKGPFARYWLHNGMLTIDGQKMSKSIGNVVTIQSLIDRNRTAAFRLMILQSHYRVPFTYSDIILQAAQNALDRLRAASNTASASDGTAEAVAELDDLTPSVERRFIAAMSDDFDTPGATAAIFDLARAINRVGAGHPNTRSLIAAGEMLRHLTGILGLRLDEQPKQPSSDIGPYVELLIDIRNDLRAAKQFALADKIRNELTAQGVTLEDSPTGTTWKHTLG
jgi:cysteinyl-tRNA synthetase